MAPIQADIEHSPAFAGLPRIPRFFGQHLSVAGGPHRQRLEALTAQRRSVPRGDELFRQGDRLSALYQVCAGWFKTSLSDSSGRCQVTGFQMSGDMLGLDGIGDGCHSVAAVALDDALVCVIPYAGLEQLVLENHNLQREFHRMLSLEIGREQAMMLLLGTMTAERRIAAFVLDLATRQRDRGYAVSSLVLRMSRDEIGSFLGLQLETVSRSFSRLQSDGVLKIRHRNIDLLDEPALRRIVRGTS